MDQSEEEFKEAIDYGEDEFFDAVEDATDIEILRERTAAEEDDEPPVKRRASFSSYPIVEVKEEEEEAEKRTPKKSSADKKQAGKKHTLQQTYERIKNTAYDEEFFHCFERYLDEAIRKMKAAPNLIP